MKSIPWVRMTQKIWEDEYFPKAILSNDRSLLVQAYMTCVSIGTKLLMHASNLCRCMVTAFSFSLPVFSNFIKADFTDDSICKCPCSGPRIPWPRPYLRPYPHSSPTRIQVWWTRCQARASEQPWIVTWLLLPSQLWIGSEHGNGVLLTFDLSP